MNYSRANHMPHILRSVFNPQRLIRATLFPNQQKRKTGSIHASTVGCVHPVSVASLVVATPLCIESDYVKAGSGMLLMQLASGFSVGWSQKACMMVYGQLLVGEETP